MWTQNLKRAFAALSLSVIAALPAFAFEAKPVRSMLEMRQEKVIVQEWDLSCGAAALATILVHDFGAGINERDVAIGMMNRPEYIEYPELIRLREGFSLLDMQRYTKRLGLKGEGFGEMTFDDLVAKGTAIVPLSRRGYNHFVIFRGVERNRVLIADPSFGTRTLTRRQFEKMWKPLPDMGRVAFTISDPAVADRESQLKAQDDEFYTFV